MLETSAHQAAGLAALGAGAGARIAALISHGDPSSELPLMCQLCAAWEALGYPVLVLDATLQENDHRPGLRQAMTDQEELRRLCSVSDNWPVLPAARGLAALSRIRGDAPADSSLLRAHQLTELFAGYDVVLIYADAATLAQLLPASGLAPLLPVSRQEPALLSAYHALKQLLSAGKLRPTIVSVMDDQTLATRVSGHNVSRNLQNCARDFLACETPALTVHPALPEEMSRLALRTLDNALLPLRWGAATLAGPSAGRSL